MHVYLQYTYILIFIMYIFNIHISLFFIKINTSKKPRHSIVTCHQP